MWFGRCARSWCDGDGVVRVDFDGEARRVWIDDAREGRMAPALVLCRRHASALTPPLNWELHDLRTDAAPDAPPVVPDPAPARTTPASPSGPRSRPAPAPVPVPAPALFEPARRDATGWLPRFDRADDLGGVLDAHSPLLARAFASVHDPT